jgi:hypothetical protein
MDVSRLPSVGAIDDFNMRRGFRYAEMVLDIVTQANSGVLGSMADPKRGFEIDDELFSVVTKYAKEAYL